jgi:hypothetical protein
LIPIFFSFFNKIDTLVSTLNFSICFIPADAGIQCFQVDIDSGFRWNHVLGDFLLLPVYRESA